MELYGNWTGISYYPKLKDFVLENTMKLSIILGDERGNLRANVTEICELPSSAKPSKWKKPLPRESEYQLSGRYNKEEQRLVFTGECRQPDRNMTHCSLELTLIEEEEKLDGVFRNLDNEKDCQRVELHKGNERRDLIELQEMGRLFLEKIKKMDAEEKKAKSAGKKSEGSKKKR